MVNTINPDIILNHMTESMIVLNQNDEVVFFNSVAGEHQHIFKKYYDVGSSFSDLIAPQRKEIVQYILQQVRSTRKPQTTEAEYREPEGRSHFFEITYNPVIDTTGELVHICVVSRDITYQKVFERKATELLNEFADLILNANAIIFGIDSRGYVTEWNAECSRISGFSKNEVFARKFHEFIAGSQAAWEGFLRSMLEEKFTGNYELQLRTQTGDPVTLLVNPTLKKNSEGLVIGALFVGQDITELSRYRFSLEQQVKERTEKLKESLQKEKELVEIKNRFVAIASHEFRVPLSLIRAGSRFMRTNENLRDEDIEKLNNIEKQVSHMNALLEDILTVQKEPSRIKVSAEKLDLILSLENIVRELSSVNGNMNRIRFTFNTPVLWINSDEKLIRNIFTNILSNALKFSPEESLVYLGLMVSNESITIRITDFGIGIVDSELEHISEPFYRASNAACINGTGLGLSIVKKAVDTLGGSFHIESKLGEGTTVTVRFPTSESLLDGYLRPFE